MTNGIGIVGWSKIVASLAAYFSVLKRRPNHLTPFNLFLSGKPGTNKSEGLEEIASFLGHSWFRVDASTIDDISELAGIVNARESRLIEGEALKAELLILDEILNTRPHVLPQFRLFLQGEMVLYGRKVRMENRAILSAGNLDEDMLVGQANVFDSPTADRFAMLVRVPSFSEMSPAEQEAILEESHDATFATAFANAIEGIDTQWELAQRELGAYATRFVRSLATQLAGSPFAFEGRRAKLLRGFVLAAMALCRAEPERLVKETVWAVVHDCLTYHKLAGLQLDQSLLRGAFETAVAVLENATAETLIAEEPTLEGKIALVVNHPEVSAITKADVFGQVMTRDDVALQVAAQALVRSPRFKGQPREIAAMIERIQFNFPYHGIQLDSDGLARFSQMPPAEAILIQLTGGNEVETARLLAQVNVYLAQWGVE